MSSGYLLGLETIQEKGLQIRTGNFFWLLAVYRYLHVAEIQESLEKQGKWQQPQGFSFDLLSYGDISCDSAVSAFFMDSFLHLET